VAAGRQITLVVPAGSATPSWVFQPVTNGGAGATQYTFSVSDLVKSNATCTTINLAAPWDTNFLTAWDTLLAQLAAHLRQIGVYSNVALVRLTGINQKTEELRLPVETPDSKGVSCVSNCVAIWQQAGYTPSNLLTGWSNILNSFQKNFPDKAYNLALIPYVAFPGIDNNGNLISGTVPDRNQPLLALAAQKFPGRLVIQMDSLFVDSAPEPEVVQSAQSFGNLIGYQTNERLGGNGAVCTTGGAQCDDANFLAMLENGIYPLGRTNRFRAQYIEVFAANAVAFTNAIWQAHLELVTPP